MKLNTREQVKLLLMRRKTTLTELAQYMAQDTGKDYTFASLRGKLRRGSLSHDEFLLICDILHYEVDIKDLMQ